MVGGGLIAVISGAIERADSVALSPGSSGRVVLEDREEAVRTIIAVGDSYLQVHQLEALYQTLATADLPARHDVSIYAYPGEDSDLWATGGRRLSEAGPSFDQWRESVVELRRARTWGGTRLISTIDGVVVQIAKDGNCSSLVISGRDPTQFSVNGRKFELLWTHFYSRPGQSEIMLEAWVKAETVPTLDYAKLLTEEIRGKLPAKRLQVWIRSDVWFVYNSFFPAWFPFCKRQETPTWQDFSRAKQIYCRGEPTSTVCYEPSIPSSPTATFATPGL